VNLTRTIKTTTAMMMMILMMVVGALFVDTATVADFVRLLAAVGELEGVVGVFVLSVSCTCT
jgi:hypothetical protein